MSGAPLLEVRDVTVRFGGLNALDRVSLQVAPGAITGLIGPNGAGKTTLFNIVTGLQRPRRGQVLFEGDDVSRQPPHRRARRGIARTFQRLETFRTLSVRDNVLVAAEMTAGHRQRDGQSPGAVADAIVDRVGLGQVADRVVEGLPTGTQRLVELGRALAAAPKLLLLDEPSSGLGDAETTLLGALLQELARDGLGVLLVEHDMAFVMGLCDEINVLDFGRIVAVGEPAAVQDDPAVRNAYLGQDGPQRGDSTTAAPRAAPADPAAVFSPARAAATGPAGAVDPAADLELRNVTAGHGAIDVVHDLSLVVTHGAVTALLGPNGAGKSTTLQVAAGALRPSGGDVLLHGEVVTGRSADARARAGLCCVPEGRSVFPNLTVVDNLLMSTYLGVSLRDIEEQTYARFPVLGERRQQLAGSLSGGEQQMLAMARALVSNPSVLLLDELSMGLAPLVVARLYDEVAAVASQGGVAILVVEQFAHEVLAVADQALVMVNGRIALSGRPDDVAAGMDALYLGSTVA